ncbi:MAG: DNA repair protein RadC [Kiritimatiellae bacterium]|nr:DNA repair protein RadC [Kiritimatiellia bacterium]
MSNNTDYNIETSAFRVCDIPERLRPREEMERLGVDNVSDDVLLSVLLRSGVKGVSVVDLARALLKDYGSLTALAGASMEQLAKKKGMGRVKAQVLMSAFELAKRMSEENMPVRCRIKTPEDAARLFRSKVKTIDKEMFWVLLLDVKNRLKIPPVNVTVGILDASLVHPREVFREAVRAAGAAIVLVHNHPSGDPSPSAEDIRITKQMVEAGRSLDIKVLDHVIIGRANKNRLKDFLSLREAGLVNFA